LEQAALQNNLYALDGLMQVDPEGDEASIAAGAKAMGKSDLA
jgi:hypothetical protein